MQKQIAEFIKDALKLNSLPKIEIPAQDSFGHFSTNIALVEAKKQGKDAKELSAQLIKQLIAQDGGKLFAKIEVAGPGFINFWLRDEFLKKEFKHLKVEKILKFGQREKVIIDYSSPNIAKPMHVGHLRSIVIGDSLSRIYEKLGYKVIRWNYLGDWGTQFGKLIAAYRKWGSEEELKKDPIAHLLALYVRFNQEVKDNKALDDEARQEFKKLEEGDKENQKLWKEFKQYSLQELKETYQALGASDFNQTLGESDYESHLQKTNKLLESKELLKESEGAIIVDLEEEGLPPALVKKSDGASLYLTRDIAMIVDRVKRFKARKILYVVGNEQSLYFQQLFAVAKKLGIKAELQHIKHGLIIGEKGKFSTRSGNVLQLKELIIKAEEKAMETIKEKNPQLGNMAEAAKIIGIGALKFNDLRENRQSDIKFNWERMLDVNGDSGPYLQYSYARLKSILRKIKAKKSDLSLLKDEMELRIMKKNLDFSDVLILCQESNLTSHLAKYLLDLAHILNSYYESTSILKTEDAQLQQARLYLIAESAKTLKTGLNLLGIEVLEEI